MTTTTAPTIDPPVTTESDFDSIEEVEEGAIRARTRRARATVKKIVTQGGVGLQRLPRRWWLYTTRPMSLRASWRLSRQVDPTRIPLGWWPLRVIWRWEGRLTRPLWYALALCGPHLLTGPVLWCAARPSRRWTAYTLTGLLAVFLWAARTFR